MLCISKVFIICMHHTTHQVQHKSIIGRDNFALYFESVYYLYAPHHTPSSTPPTRDSWWCWCMHHTTHQVQHHQFLVFPLKNRRVRRLMHSKVGLLRGQNTNNDIILTPHVASRPTMLCISLLLCMYYWHPIISRYHGGLMGMCYLPIRFGRGFALASRLSGLRRKRGSLRLFSGFVENFVEPRAKWHKGFRSMSNASRHTPFRNSSCILKPWWKTARRFSSFPNFTSLHQTSCGL